MSFQPTIPLSGVGGWQLLQRTEETQRALFGKKADLAADIAYNRNEAAAGDRAWSYGAFLVQQISIVGTELYAGVRVHELDHGGVTTINATGVNFLNQINATSDPKDVIAVMTGARVKF